ncbi:MAG: hypothetical protein JO235_16495 [Chroococcidiopsidaceae cyanobacterium CP_BM_RX_35]|nr:hypothetical protein [Chroococcidiopsidaceae cyanobacterium CP_BM_RX_35]
MADQARNRAIQIHLSFSLELDFVWIHTHCPQPFSESLYLCFCFVCPFYACEAATLSSVKKVFYYGALPILVLISKALTPHA